jgi:electron transport complex protein RnfB
VVPVGISVEHKTAIATYDDIKQIIASAEEPFIVTNCVCRQYWDVLKKSCKNTDRREVCIGWGRGAKMYTKQGWGKPISREEALAILKENEKQGMILQPSNAQQPDFVCSCCTCCDINLKFLKSMPTPATFIASNYVAQSDPALCTGCGTCVDRCQMAAVTLQEEKSVVNEMRCIGCGNCAATCPSEAMSLKKKDYETVPPTTVPDLYEKMLQTRNKIKEREMKKKARLARRGG